ncbi:GPW/gp25 family protein [Pseudovibrio sp. Ad26]|uniref:GPW/gp25 family protein n=1 Tax=Pseudovibrio sp. Ad26 TaxID=989410 RepID=UPI0007AE54F7|nr:GPW/gp25 family protein [Pseudovibrio sp. Ad26]KZL10715.1 Gene 25-like lysozyme [Pseudovibrio sp. Ad26]
MAGISRHAGQPISNLQSALQGVEVTLGTRLYSRVMRRQFGAGFVEILGKKLSPKRFAVFMQLIAVAIDRWEPRFKVRRLTPQGTVEQVRLGAVGLTIEADFRPKAHLSPPDFTVERSVSFGLFFRDGKVQTLES